MNYSFLSFFYVVMFFNLFLILCNLNHLLNIMLIFEFMGLNLVFLCVLGFYKKILYLILMFLVLLACEASIGLSLLVSMIRFNYMQYVENFNIFII